MTLATRCPACGTVFRVVQDQLRVSQGWVRCGRCSEAFNAVESMVDSPTVALPESRSAAIAAAGSSAGASTSGGQIELPAAAPAPAPVSIDPAGRPVSDVMAEPPAAAQAEAPAGQAPPASPMIELPAGLALIASDGGVGTQALLGRYDAERIEPSLEPDEAPPAGAAEVQATQARSSDDQGRDVARAPDPSPIGDDTDAAPPPAPSFLVKAERAERWRRPGVRLALGLLALIGTLGLAGQVTHAWRDRAAASFPPLRPLLHQACAVLGCVIDDFRQIEALSVESSGLVRVEGSPVYRLSVTLRNRAAVEVAAPALDLTLTDAQGRQIARRVLQMSDLKLPLRTLKPGSELPIQVPLGIGGAVVSGYTVEIFYP
jgi:predicted Zn finger-like uncharacterized protein